MNVSNLIAALETYKAKYGDMPVCRVRWTPTGDYRHNWICDLVDTGEPGLVEFDEELYNSAPAQRVCVIG